MSRTATASAVNGEQHAVVIGASIAGLLAARALSETYARVTVIDRDELPSGPHPRRGVPQSRQAHALLAGGSRALEELFPGFCDDMVASGVRRVDTQLEALWVFNGHSVPHAASGVVVYHVSRPLIEHMIRERVASLPGVEIRQGCEVAGLVTDVGDRVAGVRCRTPMKDGREPTRAAEAEEETLPASLVVDAGGRASRSPAWLAELGYPAPPTTEVKAKVVYVTRHYRREEHHLDGRAGVAVAAFPGLPRGGAVIEQEGAAFAVILVGLVGEVPPTDDAGMLAYAESLPTPHVADILRSAEPLDEAVLMRYPASVRHDHENFPRRLENFLVVGDALCSFAPTYGQGITVCALEAVLLRSLLQEGTRPLSSRFFSEAARIVDPAWSMAAGGDLRFPETTGERKAIDKIVNWYMDRYYVAASVDAGLGTSLLRVAQMLDKPAKLLSPGHVLRVLRHGTKTVPTTARAPGIQGQS